MILTIGKPTQYTSDGMAILGQTDWDKPGWRLRYLDHGTELEIYRGSFAMCRRIQEASERIAEPKNSFGWLKALRELSGRLSGIPTVTTMTEPTAEYVYIPDFESPPSDE